MSNPVFLKTELMKGSPNPNFNLDVMKIKQGVYEDVTANLDCDVTTMMTEVVIVSDGVPLFPGHWC